MKKLLLLLLCVPLIGFCQKNNQIILDSMKCLENKMSYYTDTLDYLKSQLKELKEKNPTLDLSNKDYGTFFQKQKIEGIVSQYQIHLSYYKALLSCFQNSDNTECIPSGISNPELQRMILKFIKLKDEKKTLELSILENHPKYQALESEINDSKQSIIENLKNLINSTNSAKRELQGRIDDFDKEIQQLPKIEKEYLLLTHNISKCKVRIDSLQNRIWEIKFILEQ